MGLPWYFHIATRLNGTCLATNGDQGEHAGISVRNCGANSWQGWTLPKP